MNSQDFFKRWKQLGNEPSQETQKIFAGKFPSNPASVKESVSILCSCINVYCFSIVIQLCEGYLLICIAVEIKWFGSDGGY